MFCTKCGKEINYDSLVCIECVIKAKQTSDNANLDSTEKKATSYFETPKAEPAYQVEKEADFVESDFVPTDKEGYSETLGGERSGFGGTSENPYKSAGGAFYTPAYSQVEQSQPPKNRVMVKFGIALTSAILSFFAYVFSISSMALVTTEESIGFVFLFVIAIPATVLSIIFGAKGISAFKRRHIDNSLPIPALALGIFGVFMGSLAALISFISMMML